MAWPVLASVCAVLLGMLVIGVLTIGDVGIMLVAIALLCGAFTVGLAVITIRIDEDGIRARSLLGFSAVEASLSEIESVSVRDVKAFGEFGGWGLRSSPEHGLGMILRSGPALALHQHSGQTLTVTIRDAHEAAQELERRGIRTVTRAV